MGKLQDSKIYQSMEHFCPLISPLVVMQSLFLKILFFFFFLSYKGENSLSGKDQHG